MDIKDVNADDTFENEYDFMLQLEPYFFVKRLIKSNIQDNILQLNGKDESAYTTFQNLLSVYTNSFESGKTQVYNFSEELINLMKDSSQDDRKYFSLPFPCIFLNNKIYFEKENTWITGILIIDNNSQSILDTMKFKLKGDNIGMYYIGHTEGKMFHGVIPNFNSMLKDEGKFQCLGGIKPFYLKIYDLVYSIINLISVEHEDIITFVQDNSERNKKRIKREKETYPNKIKYIKLGGKTLRYAKAYSHAKTSSQFKSYVHGFFRTYKDDRYVNMQGKTQWIFPFVRGAELPERPELQLVKVSATEEFMESIKNGN